MLLKYVYIRSQECSPKPQKKNTTNISKYVTNSKYLEKRVTTEIVLKTELKWADESTRLKRADETTKLKRADETTQLKNKIKQLN